MATYGQDNIGPLMADDTSGAVAASFCMITVAAQSRPLNVVDEDCCLPRQFVVCQELHHFHVEEDR